MALRAGCVLPILDADPAAETTESCVFPTMLSESWNQRSHQAVGSLQQGGLILSWSAGASKVPESAQKRLGWFGVAGWRWSESTWEEVDPIFEEEHG